MAEKNLFKAGMFLLETLTSGMYNEPLTIYREYIQNSVDSIDKIKDKKNQIKRIIEIELKPLEKEIKIIDNGPGIPHKEANKILSGIGISSKDGYNFRGFRGIGRLGGLAFCNKAIFRTKSINENIESIQEWDCIKLKNILANSNKSLYSLKDIFNSVTKFSHVKNNEREKSFFEVTLKNVFSFRNYILDIKKVQNYLSQIAPVDFNYSEFPFANEINKFLLNHVHNYNTYNIFLNKDKVYKPYKNKVKITKSGYDQIEDISFVELINQESPIAYGWFGNRRDFLGSIIKGDDSASIRIRSGNLMIGDSNIINKCFRESRFNNYNIGEIHITSKELIPNGRRDDFIDNLQKNQFYNEVEKKIGLILSKKIRFISRQKSNSSIRNENIDEKENSKILMEKKGNKNKKNDSKFYKNFFNEIIKSCGACDNLQKIKNIEK
jgi:molecular chaperone HtpG